METCARCRVDLSSSEVGEGVLRCHGCGSFVCRPEARQKLCRFLHIDDVSWNALLDDGGRGPPCPLCADGLRVMNLNGVWGDGCGACGALVLDPGELQRLTGRDEKPPPGPAVSRAVQTLASTRSAGASPPSRDAGDMLVGVGRVHLPPQLALAHFLEGMSWVQVRQDRPSLSAASSIVDTGARYAVTTSLGSGMLCRDEGPMGFVARLFLGSLVTQRFVLKDPDDNPMLVLGRHVDKLVLSRLNVALDDGGDPGRLLGSVERNLRIIETRYELKDPHGLVWGRLVRPLSSMWQFRLETPDGRRSGAVAKEWSGFASEFFTDADDFGIDFGDHPWTLEQRAVIVTAALAIDLDHFERGRSTPMTSLFDLLD
jgi:hypothetical protein